jgi:DNA-binding transcriptional ArsR family regulator
LTSSFFWIIFNHMVNFLPTRIDSTFHALSDPTRRAILTRLSRGEATVTELAKPFNSSLPAVSKHLKVLEEAQLVKRRRDGRIHRISLEPIAFREATEWIEQMRRFWEGRLAALAAYLESETPPDSPPNPPAEAEGDPNAELIPPSYERCD